jgi:hypothetical protein
LFVAFAYTHSDGNSNANSDGNGDGVNNAIGNANGNPWRQNYPYATAASHTGAETVAQSCRYGIADGTHAVRIPGAC